MKAVVLAGGHATRLWPVTKNRAKPLLPLGERPIIDFIVDDLDEVDEIIISTNAKFKEDFEDYVDEYDREDTRVVVEDQDSEEEKPGTIGAILKLIETEDLEDDLFIIGGDNYLGFDLSDFLEFAEGREGPSNVVYDVKQEEMAKSFGIVDTDGERIVGFEEKPEEPPSTLASTACYFFPEEKVSLFQEYEQHFQETDVPKEQYLDEPGRLIEWAHEETPMFAFDFDGDWFDIGTPRGYLNAMNAVIDSKIVNGETEDCVLGENVYIMEGAEAKDSTIKNSIIFPNVTVEESEVRNSIIDRKSDIKDIDLNDAVIGEHSTL
ncbi:MAG: sugar phosphate nucleotidyltransferase [Candidatus Nanohalobium sp.]